MPIIIAVKFKVVDSNIYSYYRASGGILLKIVKDSIHSFIPNLGGSLKKKLLMRQSLHLANASFLFSVTASTP